MLYLRTILTVILLFSVKLYGWTDYGHMMIAEIAWRMLDQTVKERVEELITRLDDVHPEAAGFVNASVWADDIKSAGWSRSGKWHTYSIPYDPDCILTEEEKEKIFLSNENCNAIWMMQQCVDTLSDAKSGEWEKAVMLRFLIHLVGDIHQPLHCISRYNIEFPEGDMGATKLFIYSEGERLSLHIWWDLGGGMYPRWRKPSEVIVGVDIPRPTDDAGLQILRNDVNALILKYPITYYPNVDHFEFISWVKEFHQIAIDQVYDGVEGETPLSDEYIARAHGVMERQIALAGYRLGILLNNLLH